MKICNNFSMLYMLSPSLYCNTTRLPKNHRKQQMMDGSSGFFVTLNKKIIKESMEDRDQNKQKKSNLEETMIIQGDKNTHKSYQ